MKAAFLRLMDLGAAVLRPYQCISPEISNVKVLENIDDSFDASWHRDTQWRLVAALGSVVDVVYCDLMSQYTISGKEP